MTLPFALHSDIDIDFDTQPPNSDCRESKGLTAVVHQQKLRIIADKIAVPTSSEGSDDRLNKLLERSAQTYAATMISGRAGTGKTAAGAAFAGTHDRVAWYTLDSSDIDWPAFSSYFSAAIQKVTKFQVPIDSLAVEEPSVGAMSFFLSSVFEKLRQETAETSLIVLDDLHHVFDAPWFRDFFDILLYSIPSCTHLLLLCRSKPPLPLWRLRSKQLLNVLDERTLLAGIDDESVARETARPPHTTRPEADPPAAHALK